MNTPLLAVACVLLGGSLGAQTTHYVASSGTGDGSSWSAASSLHHALSEATFGDAIWLQTGTYFTSATHDREATFSVPDGVRLLGGFQGNEQNDLHRDPVAFATVLSGELGTNKRTDNAYTVVTLHEVGDQTVLDGLTITAGYANGAGPVADAKRAGGGVLITATRHRADVAPRIIDCVLSANYARDGGAVYVDARGTSAAPIFSGCTFADNEADLDGGAIYSDGRHHGTAVATITDCTFRGNVANYGGAAFNQATGGTCTLVISQSSFSANRAFVRGASLYAVDHRGESIATLTECEFEQSADVRYSDGGMMARGE